MWKSRFTVVANRVVFHNPCGKRCGKLRRFVENIFDRKVFHISTGPNIALPVEMWKTLY
jgi:hypothetical protein